MRLHSSARPIRIAYLIDDSENNSLILDAIAQASYSAWGGRFSLIIPLKDGEIPESFALWLEKYDPDVIYAYGDLTENSVQSIHERFYPSLLRRHPKDETKSIFELRPKLNVSALSVETLMPLLAQMARHDSQSHLTLIETSSGEIANDNFTQINFGQYYGSMGRSFPQSMEEHVRLLHVLKPNECQPRNHFGLQGQASLENRVELLNYMANSPFQTMASLAARNTPRLNFHYQEWAHSFSIVVGDSFTDRVTNWNARSLYPRWRDTTPVQLWLPEKDIDDISLVSGIAEFLSKRNAVSKDESHGQNAITIYSASVSVDRLEQFSSRLKSNSLRHRIAVKKIESVENHVPASTEISNAYFASSSEFGAHARRSWQQDEIFDREISLEAPKPDHLELIAPNSWSVHSGAWAVDLAIQRENDLSPHNNVKHDWILPRRLRMANAFQQTYEMSGTKVAVTPRVNNEGFLTSFSNKTTGIVGLKVPTDHVAFRCALTHGQDWWPFEQKSSAPPQSPEQIVYAVDRSNPGSYFWGTLGMFGDLDKVANHLLVEYWREQFAALGGSPKITNSSQDQVEEKLQKVFRTQPQELISNNFPKIAKIALEIAQQQKQPLRKVRWTDLQEAQHRAIPQYVNSLSTEEREEEIARLSASLEASVKRLCRMGVLHQGYELTCRTCLHRNWFSIDHIKSEVTCEVCHSDMDCPVQMPWHFRLNGFLRESLSRHGILPLFWALERRRIASRNSFFFEGPIKLFYNYEKLRKSEADAEIDLIVVSDGKVEIIEAKTSDREIDIEKFANVVKRLRPDFATIAVMEAGNKKIQTKFKALSNALADTRITPKLMTLEDEDFRTGANLSEAQSFKLF